MQILPNVHLISGPVVNCSLIVEPGGLTLIDTGLPGYVKRITRAITSLGHSPSDLKTILITHADGDHAGTLAHFEATTGAKSYASPLEAQAIAAGRSSRELKTAGLTKLLVGAMSRFFQFEAVAIDHLLGQGQEFPILGGLLVFSTPGHTPGHISFYAPAPRLLFAGDSMTASNKGLRVSTGANTWDEEKARASFRLQKALAPEIVVAGHGPVVRAAPGKFLE